MHFTQELLMNIQCSASSGSLAKTTRALQMKRAATDRQKWRQPPERTTEADPLPPTQEAAQELNSDHPTLMWHLKESERVNKLDKWVPHELIENQNIRHFEVSSSLSLPNNHVPFLDWIVMCNEKWILHDSQRQLAHWVDVEKALRHFPNPNLLQEKGHGHCLVVCCSCDPWELSESWRNHYIWEVCSASQWDVPKTAMPAAGTGQRKGPNSSPQSRLTACCTTNASKAERSLASPAIFTWPLTNSLPLLQASLQLFEGKMLPQPARCKKCFPWVHQIPKHGFLCYRNKQTYFSLAQIC